MRMPSPVVGAVGIRGLALLVAVWSVCSACDQDIRAGRAGESDTDAFDVRDARDSRDTVAAELSDSDAGKRDVAPDLDSGPDSTDADAGFQKGPPYPVVLAHGFGGFEHLADVDQLEYFYRVPEHLREAGETVLVTEVEPFSHSYLRGEQLLDQIEKFTEEQQWEKVHIIGHSQGGLDARYVAHLRPDLVASVVTISTPHGGTQVADIALDLADSDATQRIINELSDILGQALYDESGEPTGAVEALKQFSNPGIGEFNKRVTDRPGVYYASIAGRTDRHLGGTICDVEDPPEFIEKWEDTTDPVDPILSVTEGVLDGSLGQRPSDGMVGVENAIWGDFLGCIPADHLDEVGQLLGDDPGALNDWDYLAFYENLVDYLHARE